MTERARPRRLAAYLAVVAANLYPLVGVLAFDWDLATVLVLYWVEMGVAAAWAVPKALLTEQRDRALSASRLPLRRLREKRGGWTIRGVTVYAHNVPTALLQLVMLGVVWVGIGLFFAYALHLRASAVAPLTVAVGALGMAVAHGASFVREYVGEREYEDVSARMTVAHTGQQALLVLVLAFPVGASETFRAGGVTVVAGVVAAKLAVETYNRWIADGPGDGFLAAVVGTRDTAVAAPAVPVPERAPDARRRPDPRAVRIECALRGLSALVSRPALLVVCAGLFAAFVDVRLLLVPLALLAAGFCLGAAGRYVHLGGMEVRRYGDALVGYDRHLDEPQWRAPLDACDASIPRRLVDRYAGTVVVRLDWSGPADGYWPDGEYDPERTGATVGPFDDFAAVTALDLPVSPADRPEPNRTVAYAALTLVATFTVLPALVWHASGLGAAIVVAFLLVVVVGPFLVVAVYYL